MTNQSRRFLPLLLLFLLTACARPSTLPPGMSEADIQRERNLQTQAAMQEQQRKEQVKSENRAALTARVQRTYQPIAESALGLCREMGISAPDCVYPVILDESGELNAYADGKAIHIAPAMARFAENDEELAFVLAHELAHNIMEHPGSQQVNAVAGMVLGALVDGLAASQGLDMGGAFTRLGGQAGVLHYSKDFEREADYIGMYILARAGFNYRDAPAVWRRFAVREPNSIYLGTTHPTTPERFVMMERIAEEIDRRMAAGQALVPQARPQEDRAVADTPAYPGQQRRNAYR